MAKGKQLRRRSHLALKPKRLLKCSHCDKMILPHAICKFCGYYEGKEIINIVAKTLAKQQKRTQRSAH